MQYASIVTSLPKPYSMGSPMTLTRTSKHMSQEIEIKKWTVVFERCFGMCFNVLWGLKKRFELSLLVTLTWLSVREMLYYQRPDFVEFYALT